MTKHRLACGVHNGNEAGTDWCGEPAKTVFLYSGHGSQTYHMGVSIYTTNRIFSRWMDELDTMMMSRLGYSILKVLYDPMHRKSEPFDDIRFTHPAIFMVEFALTKMLIEASGLPSCLLGSSLGELICAVVSDAISLEDAIDIIAHHVEALVDHPARGGMLAVVGPSYILNDQPALSERCEIAATFDDSHFVVAGGDEDLCFVRESLEQQAIDCYRLPVKYAFHSSKLDDFADAMDCAGLPVQFGTPKIPVVSASSGQLVRRFSSEHIWNAIRLPLKIDQALAYVGKIGSFDYIDLGPGSAFVRILQSPVSSREPVRAYRVLSALGNEAQNVANAAQALAGRHG